MATAPNRKHVRRKRMNKIHAPPTKLTEARMDELTKCNVERP